MSLTFASSFTQKSYTWTNWKSVFNTKGGVYQYYDDGSTTTVYFYDEPEVYLAVMWDGTVPDSIIAGGYSQAQNNSDLSDFQTNWLPGANKRISSASSGLPVLSNATVTVGGSQIYTGFNNRQINLIINVKNAPTGTNPTLTFSLQEMDPGDKSTALRSSITGAAIKVAGTQVLTLPLVSSGVVQVAWTIGGTASPTFTGVYVTAICKTGVTAAEVYGDLYYSSINSMVFEAATATTGVAPGTTIGTTGAFTLYNPKTSTKNLVVIRIRTAYVSGTLGSGTTYLCANTNPAAAAVTGTAITITSSLIGGTGATQAQAFTTSTLPAAPTVIKPLLSLTPILATSVFPPYQLEDDTEGKYVILPGCALSMESVAAAGTTPKVVYGMSWVEVPF